MSRRWRILVLATLGLVAIPFAYLTVFDATWFYPRLSAMRLKVRAASHDEQSPSPKLAELIDAMAGDSLAYVVAREVSTQAGPEPSELSPGQWNRYGLASTILVNLHCS